MKNKLSFRIFWIVMITLIICAVAVGCMYWQKSHTNNEFNSSSEEIALRSVGEEIVSLRTANTQTFKGNNPNEFTTRIYTSAAFYFDKKDSSYKEIDTSTHKIADIAKLNPFKTYDAFVDAGNYKATWFADKPWNYKFSVGDSWIEYEALFDESSALDISVETSEIGIKETITLKDDTAPTTLSWKVAQSIGKSAIATPPPTAIDAEGKNIPVSESKIGDILTYQVDTAGAVFPIAVDPTSVTATNDGTVYHSGGSYAANRDAISGSGIITGDIRVGQAYNNPDYEVHRGFLSFAIPSMTSISAATLNVYGEADFSTTDFTLNAVNASAYLPTLTTADFKNFTGWAASGSYVGFTPFTNNWSSASYSAGWISLTVNAAGLAAILAAQNNTLGIALISQEDVNNSTPTTEERVFFYSSASADKKPYLSITYTIPVSAPTVTTQDASSITTTSAVFNGTITAIGGTNATVRGFTYGIDPSLSTPIATTVENGSFGIGAFTGVPSSVLTCNTVYYYRAYATNSGGTGLGTIATFTTSACAIPPVNGACSTAHYNCTSPLSSINRVDGTSFWTWSCPGSNGGTTASCYEEKSIQPPTTSCSPLYLAPTHIYTQQSSGGTVTAFTRTIQAVDISPTDERIISTVSWNYHGTQHSVTITDHLTPWQ